MSKRIIIVNNLSKEFVVYRNPDGGGKLLRNMMMPTRQVVTAVDNVSFTVDQGEAVGYIGVNGAGKSTTIKMLCGILVPTKGTVEVMGLIPHKHRETNATNIGVLFGQRSILWWDVPVRNSLWLLKRIYQIPNEQYNKNLSLFNDVLDLKPLMNVPVRELSLGQRMRANLAAVFLHNPKVVYLDEPTIGLDVVVKKRIREFLNYMVSEQGCSLFLTTHDLRDVEEICSRIIVLDQGKVLFDGLTTSFINRYNLQQSITVQLSGDNHEVVLSNQFGEVDCISLDNNKFQLLFNPKQYSLVDITQFLLNKYSVMDLKIDYPNLENVIQEIYKSDHPMNLPSLS
jgi:ABC-2 type transport system ATP-binding protein